MNLYLRLLWTLLTSRRKPPIAIGDVIRRTFHVLPNDLDINAHMNNGRYLTIVDLMIVEYFIRSGFARVLLRNKWRPILGGSIISYRRSLAPFASYDVTLKAEGSDQFWNYLRFEFLSGGRICAVGYIKGAAVSRQGLVDTATAFAALGGVPTVDLPPGVQAWKTVEAGLLAQ